MNTTAKTPVYLLTGFLGAGKTTFLNRLLKQKKFANSLVIINEFGAVSIDHLLVEESAETIFELSNGCLCCSVRGELVETLANFDLSGIDRIFVETTGIADPLPVFQAMAFHPSLSKTLLPAPILCVYDCERGDELLKQHAEARRQLAIADTIILSKCGSEALETAALEAIGKTNPNAQVVRSDEPLDAAHLSALTDQKTDLDKAGKSGHSGEYRSTVLETDAVLSPQDMFGLLQMIINHYGENLLRIKGHALLQGFEKPAIIQVSGQIVHEPEPAATAIDKTRLVVIVKDEETKRAIDLFNAISGQTGFDTADRDALLNNPLAVPGASF